MIIIENAIEENLLDIENIEKHCFSHPWSYNSLKQTLENNNSIMLIAKESDETIAYCSMNFVLDEGYINNIAVLESHRQKGIGKALLEKLINYSVKHNFSFITLEVRSENTPAINLYTKYDFMLEGKRKNYYHCPDDDCLIMTKRFRIGEKV